MTISILLENGVLLSLDKKESEDVLKLVSKSVLKKVKPQTREVDPSPKNVEREVNREWSKEFEEGRGID